MINCHMNNCSNSINCLYVNVRPIHELNISNKNMLMTNRDTNTMPRYFLIF